MANGSFSVCCPCSIRPATMPRPPSRPREQMGVKVKMVTGDALAIARETAKKLGMGTNILDASSLGDEKQQETTAVAEGHREGRRLRPGVPRTQVPHRRCPAKARPHRRHDRRRGERRPGAEEGRLRHRRFGRDGRGARGGGHRADDARPVGDHRRDQGEPQDLPADEQLCDLPHRRDAARAVVHDAGDPDLQLLSVDGGDDRDAGVAQRRRHPVHRL